MNATRKTKTKKTRREKGNKGMTEEGAFNVFIAYALNDKKKSLDYRQFERDYCRATRSFYEQRSVCIYIPAIVSFDCQFL